MAGIVALSVFDFFKAASRTRRNGVISRMVLALRRIDVPFGLGVQLLGGFPIGTHLRHQKTIPTAIRPKSVPDRRRPLDAFRV
jgi:hypothetical protein